MGQRGMLDRLADWWYRNDRDQIGINPNTGQFQSGSQQRIAEFQRMTDQELVTRLNMQYTRQLGLREKNITEAEAAWKRAAEWEGKGDKMQAQAYIKAHRYARQRGDNASLLASKCIDAITSVKNGTWLQDVAEVSALFYVLGEKLGYQSEAIAATAQRLGEESDRVNIGLERIAESSESALNAQLETTPEDAALYTQLKAELTGPQQRQLAPQKTAVQKQPVGQQTQRDYTLPEKGKREVEKI